MLRTPFTYREFWDVPRLIVCNVRDQTVLLDSSFNAENDEYQHNYDVCILPPTADYEFSRDWRQLRSLASPLIGRLPVATLEFDSTKRKWLNADPLLPLIDQSHGSV